MITKSHTFFSEKLYELVMVSCYQLSFYFCLDKNKMITKCGILWDFVGFFIS